MTRNPMASCRVPIDWKVQIDAIADATGRDSSAVVRDALAQYLQRNNTPTLQNQVSDLLIRMASLEERHRALAALVATGR